jgi:hypothetical protein
MIVMDPGTREILVERDPGRASVELQIGNDEAQGVRSIHLTRAEAGRLAALLLFEAARLERPATSWRFVPVPGERHSA